MSTSLENRFLCLRSLCRRAYASNSLYISGGAIALLTPRFVGTRSFSAMSFGSTSLVLELSCLIVVLLSCQIPQQYQASDGKGGVGPHSSSRPHAMIPLLFLCICALFALFEFSAFSFAINGGYDPSRSWAHSPEHHIEQALSSSALMAFCLLLVSRSRHASPNKCIREERNQDLRPTAFCVAALFLAGACLAGLPLLSSYVPFGSLGKPTVSYLLAVAANLIIALLASSLLWRCTASSKAALHLSFFLCGSIAINLAQRDMPAFPLHPFIPPVGFAATTATISTLALCACLRVAYVETCSRPHSSIAPTPVSPLFDAPLDCLSDRERQVLLLSAKGYTVHSIAQELGIAATTISTYKSRMSKKLKLSWQEIVDRSGIEADDDESKIRKSNSPRSPHHQAVDHPLTSSAISLAAGLSFTLLLNSPQPAPILAELLCITGALALLTFIFLGEGIRIAFPKGNLSIRCLLPGITSSLSTCAISHIPDGRMAPFSPVQHLILFLLTWCVITALNHFWSKSASRAVGARTLDKTRVRSFLNSKGIQGMYVEVAIATLDGVPASEIAHSLCISTSTVTSYRARTYAKLRVCGREGLFQLLRSELD